MVKVGYLGELLTPRPPIVTPRVGLAYIYNQLKDAGIDACR